jgi:HAD superfamily hydrolase (TIGR01509 family)
MLKAVLFDVDGTLAETEEFHRHAFNAAFVQNGLAASWSAEEYRELLRVTGGKERLAHYFALRGLAVTEERIRSLHAAKNAWYGQRLGDGSVGLRPGVQRLMTEVQAAGLRLGIATTTSAQNLDALLRPLLGRAWIAQFACVVSGDQVAHKKPAPDVYVACLQRLGLAAEEVLAIEDSPAGIGAARAAGLAVLVTPSLYTLGEDFHGATAVVPDLGEPERPWPSEMPGFARRWVDAEALRALVALAQGSRGPGRARAAGSG